MADQFPKALFDRLNIPSIKNMFITGHFGSGKTEIAVNLILQAVAESKRQIAAGRPDLVPQGCMPDGTPRKFAIVDVDIVNPYFRSRERQDLFEKEGVRLITSSQHAKNADLPALPGDINATFDQDDLFSIFDVGGDPDGARVLARYEENISREPYEFYVVVNANRPMTRTPEAAVEYIRAIEFTCGLKATGIIGNTHLCGYTTEEEIERGFDYTDKISSLTGLPVVFNAVERRFTKYLDREDVLPIDLDMLKPWEVAGDPEFSKI